MSSERRVSPFFAVGAAIMLSGSAQPASRYMPERIDQVALYSVCTPDFGDIAEDGERLAEAVRASHAVLGVGVAESLPNGESVGFTSPGLARFSVERIDEKRERVSADVGVTVFCTSFDFGNARRRLSGHDKDRLEEVESLTPQREYEGGTRL